MPSFKQNLACMLTSLLTFTDDVLLSFDYDEMNTLPILRMYILIVT